MALSFLTLPEVHPPPHLMLAVRLVGVGVPNIKLSWGWNKAGRSGIDQNLLRIWLMMVTASQSIERKYSVFNK